MHDYTETLQQPKKETRSSGDFTDLSSILTEYQRQFEQKAPQPQADQSIHHTDHHTEQFTYLGKQTNCNEAMAQLPFTDLSEVSIHSNFQLSLFTLDFPIFSLKLKKEPSTFTFTNNQGVTITCEGGELGRATVQDSDLWLYCITKMMQMSFEEKNYSRKIRFTAYNFLKMKKKSNSGTDYNQFLASLKRLSTTKLSTNKPVGNCQVNEEPLISHFKCVKDETGRMEYIEVILPEWIFMEVKEKRIARIDPSYIDLKPMEKRMYQIGKRLCQNKPASSPITLDYLQRKVGSHSPKRNFKIQMKKLTETQPLPEYYVIYLDDKDQVVFVQKESTKAENPAKSTQKIKENIEAKKQRKAREKAMMDGEMYAPIPCGKEVGTILERIEENFGGKNYPIFRTKILSEKILAQYVKKFGADLVWNKIVALIDFNFSRCENPEGYFYSILENAAKYG